jgi:hypothetical protein
MAFDIPTTLDEASLRAAILRHLNLSLGKEEAQASRYDWRMALSLALRDRVVEPWFESQRKAREDGAKRVYYLSMEFLIGRLIEDVAVNLRVDDMARDALAALGQDMPRWWRTNPTRRLAMAVWAGWRRVSSTVSRPWASLPWATASATSTAFSSRISTPDARPRPQATG